MKEDKVFLQLLYSKVRIRTNVNTTMGIVYQEGIHCTRQAKVCLFSSPS